MVTMAFTTTAVSQDLAYNMETWISCKPATYLVDIFVLPVALWRHLQRTVGNSCRGLRLLINLHYIMILVSPPLFLLYNWEVKHLSRRRTFCQSRRKVFMERKDQQQARRFPVWVYRGAEEDILYQRLSLKPQQIKEQFKLHSLLYSLIIFTKDDIGQPGQNA